MNGEGQEVSVDFAAAMLAAQMKTATEAARLYPRDEKAARKKLLKLCRDPRFAEQATFTVEQGGELIYRPSINFARPAADAWGHLHTGSRIIRTAHDEEHIEAWAFDAQSIRTVTQPGLVRKIVKRKDPETRREVWVRLEGADLIAARHREVSIVDVPGHVRFVRHMLAGIGAVDLALVVVAAGEELDVALTRCRHAGEGVGHLVGLVAQRGAQVDEAVVASGHDALHAHAGDYGIDPERIYLIGQSAGGHMVSLAATIGELCTGEVVEHIGAYGLTGLRGIDAGKTGRHFSGSFRVARTHRRKKVRRL